MSSPIAQYEHTNNQRLLTENYTENTTNIKNDDEYKSFHKKDQGNRKVLSFH